MGHWPGEPGGDVPPVVPEKKNVWSTIIGGLSLMLAVLYALYEAITEFVMDKPLSVIVLLVVVVAFVAVIVVTIQAVLYKK